MVIFFYVACISIGIALDWAIVGRAVLYAESLHAIRPTSNYKENLFPRIVVTASGLVSISYSAGHKGAHNIALWLGLTLFLLSSVYAIVKSYRS
jgi:hypothetical protein